MTTIDNYILHSTFEPSYYQRRFEHDVPEQTPDWLETGKRTLLIALPFLSLYKPLAQGISLVMGSVRCVTHVFDAINSREELLVCLGQVAKLALAALALAGTFLSFQIGLCISTTVDSGLSLFHAIEHLTNAQLTAALEETVQLLSSSLYLSIILTGSLEVILLSILLQGALNFYQSIYEYNAGRWPECIAKLTMGMIRFGEAYQHLDLIKRKNVFLSMEKFAKLAAQIKKGREASHLIYSPLDQRDHEVVLLDAEGKPYNFGTHVHGHGKGTVKGMNLQFRTQVIDGKNKTQLDFKVNHVFRDRLEILLQEIENFDSQDLKEFLDLTHSHAKNITIEKIPVKFSEEEVEPQWGTTRKIHLEGLGSISIGDDLGFPNLYDRVTVEVDEDKTLYELHELLSFFNLDDALRTSLPDDIERLKMGQLFRIFYPKEATHFERQEPFFNLPLEDLKAEIIKQAPGMQETFDEYLSKMEAREILPGRVRYAVSGLAEKLHELGARGLVSTITGPNEMVLERAASIMKIGMLSPEMRYTNDMYIHGLSSQFDFAVGSADSVFTQLFTERNIKDRIELDENLYWGDVRLILSLKVLESGTYQFHSDVGGTRVILSDSLYEQILAQIKRNGLMAFEQEILNFLNTFIDLYPNRPNILDFVQHAHEMGFLHGHEIMVKERIPPELIQGLIVPDENVKNALIENFRAKGIIAADQTIMGAPVDRFIHVGTHLSESFFA